MPSLAGVVAQCHHLNRTAGRFPILVSKQSVITTTVSATYCPYSIL